MKNFRITLVSMNHNMMRKLRKIFWLPIKWKYQKMETVETIQYPTPRELVSMLEESKKGLPKLERDKDDRAHFVKGQIDIIESILYGRW